MRPSFKKATRAAAAGILISLGSGGASLADEVPDEGLNGLLKASARKDALKIVQESATTNYSQTLSTLQSRFTNQMQAIPGQSPHSRVVFIDPNKFDSALALGLQAGSAAETVLEEHQVILPQETLNIAGMNLNTKYNSSLLQKMLFTTYPSAEQIKREDSTLCLVIPLSPSGKSFAPPDFPPNFFEEFVALHEGWHCLNAAYNDIKTDIDINPDIPDALAIYMEMLRTFSKSHKQETFADLGAAGDIIRSGKASLDILDTIGEWRSSNAQDFMHATHRGLNALKNHIGETGIERFRALSDAELQTLYYKITDVHALSPEKFHYVNVYSSSSPGERVFLNLRGIFNLDLRTAIDFVHHVETTSARTKGTPSPEATRRLQEDLLNWDGRKALIEKAFELKGEVTPESLVLAHSTLQDSLMNARDKEPKNPLPSWQMVKLKDVFGEAVRKLDYVAVNAAYGIDLEKSPVIARIKRALPPQPSF